MFLIFAYMSKDKTEYLPATIRKSIKDRLTDFSSKTNISRSKLTDFALEQFLNKYEETDISEFLKNIFNGSN